jgi:hypothetical protein
MMLLQLDAELEVVPEDHFQGPVMEDPEAQTTLLFQPHLDKQTLEAAVAEKDLIRFSQDKHRVPEALELLLLLIPTKIKNKTNGTFCRTRFQ